MKTVKFGDYIEVVTPKNKLHAKNFLPHGKYPVVSQELGQVNGYWNAPSDVMHFDKSVVVFGDHTRNVKYIDFDFVAGADGTKILLPPDDLETRYLYYWLLANPVEGLGYARHFRVLKEKNINVPSLEEQRRVVERLDAAFEKIDRAIELTEKNLKKSQEIFDHSLQDIITSDHPTWDKKTLKDISREFGRGKSKHRPRNDKKLYNGEYPFIQTGDIRNSGHYIIKYTQTYNDFGLAQSKLWPKGTICITIAANIAETGILSFAACFPDSVIGLVVDESQADGDYVEYVLQSLKTRLQSLGKGSAQDNINLGTFENELFPFPNLSIQKEIVEKLNMLSNDTLALKNKYETKIAYLKALKQSLLTQAFSQSEVE